MTTNDIDAIRKLTDAADRAPWTAHPDGLVWSELIGDPVSGSVLIENAEFIAAARTLVPALCDEVEQLRAELAKARKDRDDYAEDNTRVAVALVDVQRKLARAEAGDKPDTTDDDGCRHCGYRCNDNTTGAAL